MSNKDLAPVRNIKDKLKTITHVAIDTPTTDWLTAQAGADVPWQLLAFADDGLIWGKLESGNLMLSNEPFPNVSPSWRIETLQEVRLFNEHEQIHVWHADDGWQARRITDDVGDKTKYYDETQILWGDTYQEQKDGFTRVSDGSLGFQHAVPFTVDKAKFNSTRPLRLTVRHYLNVDDETGVLVVTLSRLVKVEAI